MILQAFAGAAFGILLGLLLGLSNSPVVAVVVGALTSGLMALMGLMPAKANDPDPAKTSSLAASRLTGFGFTCAFGLLCGMYIRTHDALTPPPAQQVKLLTDARFGEDEAHAWVAYRNAGLLLRLTPDAVADKENKAEYLHSNRSSLMATNGVDNCNLVTPTKYPSAEENFRALRIAGDPFAKLADAIEPLTVADRETAFRVLQAEYCK